MKIGIFTYGTRGDVQPYIAIALELISRGHQVLLAAPENFRSMVEDYQLEFHPLYGDAEKMMHAPEGKKVLQSENTLQLMKYFYEVLNGIKWPLRQSYEAAVRKVDLILANSATIPIIWNLAERYQRPIALSYFMPPIVETGVFPVPDLDFFNFKWYNKMTYRLTHYMYWQFVRKDINEYRKHLGLPTLKVNVLHYVDSFKPLDLYCISPSLIPQPEDWALHHKITGFIHIPNQAKEKSKNEKISNELSQWLISGEPAIYMGFGSNGIGNQEKFRAVINAVLESSQERILYCKGWSGWSDLPTNERLFVIDQVDHDSVLPLCKIGVFHGGAGTLASMLKHALPMIIISFYTDQPAWGKIIERKKLGIHIPLKRLKPARFLLALKTVQQTIYKKHTAEMSAILRTENGLKNAVDALESYFKLG